MERPFSDNFRQAMVSTMQALCSSIQGCKAGYQASDEISLLLTDFDTLTTDAWFGYNVQKMVSISAAIATGEFNRVLNSPAYALTKMVDTIALFDSRCFNIPKEEVFNYFIWRQKDWERNSLSMLAQSLYSHKELEGKKREEQHEMIFQKGHNWNDLEDCWKRGTFNLSTPEGWALSSPLLSDCKDLLNKYLFPEQAVIES